MGSCACSAMARGCTRRYVAGGCCGPTAVPVPLIDWGQGLPTRSLGVPVALLACCRACMGCPPVLRPGQTHSATGTPRLRVGLAMGGRSRRRERVACLFRYGRRRRPTPWRACSAMPGATAATTAMRCTCCVLVPLWVRPPGPSFRGGWRGACRRACCASNAL